MEDQSLHIILNRIEKMQMATTKAIGQAKVKDPLLTTIEVQEYLKKGSTWVDAHKHDIGCSKVGGEWRFRLSDVEAYINSTYQKN